MMCSYLLVLLLTLMDLAFMYYYSSLAVDFAHALLVCFGSVCLFGAAGENRFVNTPMFVRRIVSPQP